MSSEYYSSDSVVSMQQIHEDTDAEYAPQLEKDYCSNFVCCGQALADLHELVRHFEENHVTVVSPDGVPLPPAWLESPIDVPSPQTASSSALESPRSTLSSTPPPNLFPTLCSNFVPRESAFTSVTTSSSRDPCLDSVSYNRGAALDLAKEEEFAFDAILHSEAYDGNTSIGMEAPLGLHHSGSRYRISQAHLYPPSSRHLPSITQQNTSLPSGFAPAYYSHPPTLAPTPVYARPPTLSIITEPHRLEESKSVKKRRGENASWVSASEKEESLPPRRRKAPASKQPNREKAYKCPHPGCIKSYLNMNGLKYHLTKGICEVGASSE